MTAALMETVQTAHVFAKRGLLQKTVLWERTKFLACLGKKDDSLRPDSALREKASPAVIWRGERVAESRDMPLIIEISKWAYYKINSWIRPDEIERKEIYFTSIAKWINTSTVYTNEI